MLLNHNLRILRYRAFARYYNDITNTNKVANVGIKQPMQNVTDVPGLSSAVIHPANQPVGPGVDPKKSGAYKVPEYFCYNNMSYFEAEIEMSKFRCPQPSAIKK